MSKACFGSLAHVGVFVGDLERSKKFYTEVLEFDVIEECMVGDVAVAFVRNGNLTLELICDPAAQPRKDGIVDHFAMQSTNIEQIKEKLEARGIEFEGGEITVAPQVFPNGSKWMLFRGPDGEPLEISEVAPY